MPKTTGFLLIFLLVVFFINTFFAGISSANVAENLTLAAYHPESQVEEGVLESPSSIFKFRMRKSKKFLLSKNQSYFVLRDFNLEAKEVSEESGSFQKLFSELIKVYEPFQIKTLNEGVSKIKDSTSVQNLVQLLSKFGQLSDKSAAAVLLAFTNSPVEQLRCVALENIGWLKIPETFSLLLDRLDDAASSVQIRISSVVGLSNYGGVAAARELTEQLKTEKNNDVKLAIHRALEKIGGRPGYKLNPSKIEVGDAGKDDAVLVW